jgi:amidohydrolase
VPDLSALKQTAQRVIEDASSDLRALSLDVHANPELNFEEQHAHDALTAFLEKRGFEVRRGAWEMPTAFQAVAGSGSPTIAVLCEYDALPEIGHACGHNLIAASGIAAGLALKESLGEGNGTVLVLGSPAEEGGGGKVYMVERGAFEGVDAAMMLHPAPRATAWPNIIAIQAMEVEFFGKNAHASAAPWEGTNALDALVVSYNAISMLRQQMPTDARVHGVIRNGGAKPNIIPDYTMAEFYVRAQTLPRLKDLQERVMACFEAGGKATGCRVEHRWIGRQYSDMVTNDVLANTYVENVRLLGRELPPRPQGPTAFSGSTDMGNVSYAVPSIHPMFNIDTGAGNHTPEFTSAAATHEAHQQMLFAAKALALTALDAYLEPGVLEQARKEFAERVSARQE